MGLLKNRLSVLTMTPLNLGKDIYGVRFPFNDVEVIHTYHREFFYFYRDSFGIYKDITIWQLMLGWPINFGELLFNNVSSL